MNDIIKLFGLFLLLVVIGMAALKRRHGKSHKHKSPHTFIQTWRWSLGLLIVASMALAYGVDPRGYNYPHGALPPMVEISRQGNVVYYPTLDEPPDILILGSSRALNIKSEHFSGLTSYNAALISGQIAETPIFPRWLQHQHDIAFPPVLLVEMIPGLDGHIDNYSTGWPLAMLPYLPPQARGYVIESRLRAPFSLNVIVNALTQIAKSAAGTIDEKPHDPDIGSERLTFYLDQAVLDENLLYDIDLHRNRLYCGGTGSLAPELLPILDALIHIAEEEDSSIVFYFSPFQPVVYQEGLSHNPTFAPCRQATAQAIHGLMDAHPNVFFIDLTQPDGIETLTASTYFFDAWHPNPELFAWLIPQMNDTLQAAYDYAQQVRGN